ncbi:CPSF A subunit region-domain-containing protein [Neohortaea acidophila]|uniref:CPSF A subunit region-domain-containing protein n=1 Tax=Neohortaea acidophila TaxID=245834 RepID=A0A6A6PRC1_9PEZI|nr:CPSF A subunit region-domain-containing protein [Neohortaea acidophila]KAF2482465.1 CPSF A subunit region-domain-containing protein [Neohortaea acidophila]
MQCYTELLAPSVVSHAVSLPFLGPRADNCVIAKTSLLQVYGVQTDTNAATEDSTDSRLVLIGEYPLAGTVTSLAAISGISTKSGGHAILIAFRDAKLSLVEWDHENHRIATISIHYYEGDNVLSQPCGPPLSESDSILTVDPSSRCAALKFGARSLAILPFRQAEDDLGEAGEDGYDPELDIAPPANPLKRTQSALHESANGEAKQTPYKSSFVLPLTALDPSLTHPVHLSFLYEYREPTFGILSASVQPSFALLEERKDILTYTVYTLDLDQRASTNLVSVPKLPSDLWKVVPLSLPVGGALLLGTNEIVHVDQSGRTNAVAVNEFAKTASNFGMADQSDLNMKLEDCEVQALDPKTGDVLIVLSDGSMAILTFRIVGKNVGGFTISRLSAEQGGELIETAPSCVIALPDRRVFVGSDDGDSALFRWTRPSTTLSRKRSHAQMLESEQADEEDEDADEDDLYASAAKPSEPILNASPKNAASAYSFTLLDTLPSLGPINDVCFGRSESMPKDKLELAAATGRGKGSRLAFMSREITPEVLWSTPFADARNVWSLKTKAKDGESVDDLDNLLCVYGSEGTKLYDIVHSDEPKDKPQYRERTDTDFEAEDETLAVYVLDGGSRILHCRRSELRMYDAPDWTLGQIIPMLDEATDAELNIVHTAFCHPYILVVRDDSTVVVLKADASGDFEPLEAEGVLKDTKWLGGSLYRGPLFDNETLAFLLSGAGGLTVLKLSTLSVAFAISGLPNLPAVLSPDAVQRRGGVRETLTELLVTDVGTGLCRQPYLVLRSALDDLTLYEPWRSGSGPWETSLRFRKVPFQYMPKFDETTAEENDGKPAPLQTMIIGERNVIYIPGSEPSFILKEPYGQPKALGVRARGVRAITTLNHAACRDGFATINSSGDFTECRMPSETDYSTGWAVRRMRVGTPSGEVSHITYHADKQMYVVATCRDVDFYFPEDDGKHHEQDDVTLRPQGPQYTLHLLSATTRNIISSADLPYLETVTSLKAMPLEISEHSHEQKSMIVVGTALQRGEDMPAKGVVSIYELLDVVPDPERAESGCKLHLHSREETRGAITAVAPFNGGLIGTAQGQKIMIRGLKEDASCLPVAFLDAQCYTTQLKTLGRTGMFLAADAWKGLWFGGFTEEPYKLSVLGKSRARMEVVAAEFLPHDGQLFLLIVDADMDLHVLQYDPENPKSMSGARLLHRSTMHLGHFASGMTLLPSTLSSQGAAQALLANGDTASSDRTADSTALSQVLLTTTSGAVGLITPLDEATYRRLGSIQTQLTSLLEQAAGLNPRAYRAVENKGFEARGVIDGSLVQRIGELGAARRSEVLGRAGADVWTLRSDLEAVGGGGLGYL